MINIIITSNIFIGFIVFFIALLYILIQKTHPYLLDEIDGLYITLGFLYSLIIMVHGWRLDPILLFSQILIILLFALASYQKFYLRLIIFGLYANKISSQNLKEKNLIFTDSKKKESSDKITEI